ncbi:MAG TPA: hypothetical protein VLF18_08680 [Tahibacter sp.]|uniref:hypothetical protein n=1 Tax=Tahibacter sp. TaxID=2056211 RepID=UPI002CF25760|nr:hypothetical protein [Tahibacter sp.]HSX60259.1 hypothetical protein [Tahibacter sp.]
MGEQRIERKARMGERVVTIIEWRGDRGTARGDEVRDPDFYSRYTTEDGRPLRSVGGFVHLYVDDNNDYYEVAPL